MALLLAVLLSWKVALGVLGAAALVWFLLATFVASRWPALHPTLNKLRTGPGRLAVVGLVAALALGAAFVSRSASACDRTERERRVERYRYRNQDRRLVIHAGPDHRVVIHSMGHPDRLPELAMLHMTARDSEDGHDPEFAEEMEEARREAEEARREAMEEAREAAREAAEEAREAAEEARQEAEEHAREAMEDARERAEEMRERARERMEESRERAREASQRQMERAREIIERMNDEMERARDEMDDGHEGHSDSKLEALLERQAERVEQLGQTVAEQLRGLAERFHDDDDEDEDHDVGDSIDL